MLLRKSSGETEILRTSLFFAVSNVGMPKLVSVAIPFLEEKKKEDGMEEDTYETTPCRGVRQNPIKIRNCAQERGYPEPMGRQVDVVKPSGRGGYSGEVCDQQKNNCHVYVNILRAEQDQPVQDHRNAQDLGKVGPVTSP